MVDRENEVKSRKALAVTIWDFTDNLTILVAGNNPQVANGLAYYVGYKLVTIVW